MAREATGKLSTTTASTPPSERKALGGVKSRATPVRHRGFLVCALVRLHRLDPPEAEIVDYSCSVGGRVLALKHQGFGVTLCRHRRYFKNLVNSLFKSILPDSENRCDLPLLRDVG